MPVPARVVQGVSIPPLVYGTAWKEERTEPLVREALAAGFRGIDTANQRKHYHEAGVGAAVKAALAAGEVARDDLFLQTKFTFQRGQDHRLPYDPAAPVAEQVAQSFERSLAHLGVERLDAYVLHGPSAMRGLTDDDREAWRAMEALQREGRARLIGLSNVSAEQLRAFHDEARVKPAVVQNRTFTRPAADLEARTFCREQGIAYEGFSLLTAVPQLLQHPAVLAPATRLGICAAAMLLRLCAEQGTVVLTGTTSPERMREDLAAMAQPVLPEEAEAFDRVVPRPG